MPAANAASGPRQLGWSIGARSLALAEDRLLFRPSTGTAATLVGMRSVTAIVVTAGLAVLATACGDSSGNHVSRRAPTATQSSPSSSRFESAYSSFAKCMRSHGVSDFPDPVTGVGGHPGFHLQGGSNSDLNQNNPPFQRGVEACQHILGHQFRFVFTSSGVGKGA